MRIATRWERMRGPVRLRVGGRSVWGDWGLGFTRSTWRDHTQYSIRLLWWALILDLRTPLRARAPETPSPKSVSGVHRQ